MTAGVGILNKTGIAIAADSAVTVGNVQGSKVYNFANKIFMLSKYRPVGIVIYYRADFMGIPWEVLIKDYRNELDEKSFGTIKEYQEDFIRWMIQNELFYQDINPSVLLREVRDFLRSIFSHNLQNSEPIDLDTVNRINDFYTVHVENSERLIDLSPTEISALSKKIVPIVNGLLDTVGVDEQSREEITNGISRVVCDYLARDILVNYTGIVFAGYGDKELFPRLVSIKVSVALSKKILRYTIDEEVHISHEMESAVVPFAQKDVIQTILQGMSPHMFQATSEILEGFLHGLLEASKELGTIDLSSFTKDQLDQGIKLLSTLYHQGIADKMKSEHYNPMLKTISHLGREDLAEMAESLIYMTYLNRRFTMQEESVGGPVDVALITRGDGFVWMKRKHYFEPATNHHFFNNYFSKNNGERDQTEL